MHSPTSRTLLPFLVIVLAGCDSDGPMDLARDPGWSISIVSGDDQAGKAGYLLAEPLVVRVTNARGHPVAGLPILWTVTFGEGALNGRWERCGAVGMSDWGLWGDPVDTTSIRTDENGLARVSFMPTWLGPVTVTASAEAPVPVSRAVFRADASDPAATLEIVSGDGQEAVAGPWAQAQPWLVRLTDGEGAPVPYVAVTWSLSSGDGVLYTDHGCTASDSSVETRIGPLHGPGGHGVEFRPRVFGASAVTASVPGEQSRAVTFTIDATLVEIGLGYDTWSDSTYFYGPHGSSDVSVPVGAPVEFVIARGARISSTSAPPGASTFDSGTLSADERFRFVPDVSGTWTFVDQVSGARGTLTAGSPDQDPTGSAALVVSNVTTGGAFDIDGFHLRVYVPGASSRAGFLELNAEIELTGLPGGSATVELRDVAENCAVSGGFIHQVSLDPYAKTRLDLEVACAPPSELSDVRLVFSRFAPYASGPGEIYHVWAMDADGTDARPLTSGTVTDLGPRVSPDGTRIAFTRDPEGYGFWGTYELHVMSADGTGVTRLVERPDLFPWSWSPDGARIALRAGVWGWGPPNVYLIGADGTGLTRLREGFGPAWSPDGRTIAFFRRSSPTSCREIWAMDLAGRDERRLGSLPGPCETSGKEFLAWSRDGGTIYFDHATDGDAELWRIDADGSNLAPILRVEFPGSCTAQVPCYSVEFRDLAPDGTRLTLTRTGAQGTWRQDVYLADLQTGDLTRITADGHSMDAVFAP